MKNIPTEISFQKVNLTYPNGFKALSDLSFEIKKGQFVAIIGPSGAGKTTLMKTINKVNPISSGSIFVEDKEVNKLTGRALRAFRKRVGLIYQRYNLIENTTVIKNVQMSLIPVLSWYRKILVFFTKSEQLFALNCLERVGLLEKAYTRVAELSGGQMQRVALARTIAQAPSIILADEPVAALDPIMSKEIMDSFYKINREDEYTILANLHHVDLAIKYADIIIGVNKGRLVYFGRADKITKKVLAEIYGDEISIEDDDIQRAINAHLKLRKGLANA